MEIDFVKLKEECCYNLLCDGETLGKLTMMAPHYSLRETRFIARKDFVRIYKKTTEIYESGNMVVDGLARRVTINDRNVYLTDKEFDILYLLISRKGEALNRDDLYEGMELNRFSNVIDVHIKNLRAKIGKKWITTIPSYGYRFEEGAYKW